MNDLSAAFAAAFVMITTFDSDLIEIVGLSLRVSLSAVVMAALIGLPTGAALAVVRFPGRSVVIAVLNVLMGLPPVVAGLAIYLLLSRAGPLGNWGLLYTPEAMIIAQTVLVTPIVAALTRQMIEDLHGAYDEQLRAFGLGWSSVVATLLWEARIGLFTVLLAGFGRAVAEVGAVIIVGGNINHVTRVMTTAIALETSKGALDLALGLGIVLLVIVLAVNGAAGALRLTMAGRAHA
ncbi:MAG: ABC transporter permease [Rhodospirillaceae bacterium]|nr:ABC transporter permease [Rhodospirillaceae bacterium]|tara:strand:+ start:36420 stop:37127 length:708 start_codon:yes stop_codon:yes gene_type:complete